MHLTYKLLQYAEENQLGCRNAGLKMYPAVFYRLAAARLCLLADDDNFVCEGSWATTSHTRYRALGPELIPVYSTGSQPAGHPPLQ